MRKLLLHMPLESMPSVCPIDRMLYTATLTQVLCLAILSIGFLVQPLQASGTLHAGPNPDFDGNGVVDFPDFLQFVGKFGVRQGDEKYEAKFDLDSDNEIGFPDFLIFVRYFGKAVPLAEGATEASKVNSCSGSRAVPDPELVALVAECNTLLGLKDELAGDASLNWNADIGINMWDGVTVENARVTRLNLQNSNLTGNIPTELGNLTHLKRLILWGNDLTGNIPAELGNLAKLEVLLLDRNQLTGDIPAELGNLANLKRLILWGNDLTGGIPAELGNLAKLQKLILSGNALKGSIPAELGNLAKLQELVLTNNQLAGSIPHELGNLVSLDRLALNRNQLTGDIPMQLVNLDKLNRLNLVGNKLTVCIPPTDETKRRWIDNRQGMVAKWYVFAKTPDGITDEVVNQSIRLFGLEKTQIALRWAGIKNTSDENYTTALDYQNWVLQLNPAPILAAHTYYELGYNHKMLRDWHQAIKAFEKSIALEPAVPPGHRKIAVAYYELGLGYLRTQSTQKAVQTWKQLLNRYNKDSQLYTLEREQVDREMWFLPEATYHIFRLTKNKQEAYLYFNKLRQDWPKSHQFRQAKRTLEFLELIDFEWQ